MSERGSFVTGYSFLNDNDKIVLNEFFNKEFGGIGKDWCIIKGNIYAGHIGGLYSGEEIDNMESMLSEIKDKLTVEIDFVVISDTKGIVWIKVGKGVLKYLEIENFCSIDFNGIRYGGYTKID